MFSTLSISNSICAQKLESNPGKLGLLCLIVAAVWLSLCYSLFNGPGGFLSPNLWSSGALIIAKASFILLAISSIIDAAYYLYLYKQKSRISSQPATLPPSPIISKPPTSPSTATNLLPSSASSNRSASSSAISPVAPSLPSSASSTTSASSSASNPLAPSLPSSGSTIAAPSSASASSPLAPSLSLPTASSSPTPLSSTLPSSAPLVPSFYSSSAAIRSTDVDPFIPLDFSGDRIEKMIGEGAVRLVEHYNPANLATDGYSLETAEFLYSTKHRNNRFTRTGRPDDILGTTPNRPISTFDYVVVRQFSIEAAIKSIKNAAETAQETAQKAAAKAAAIPAENAGAKAEAEQEARVAASKAATAVLRRSDFNAQAFVRQSINGFFNGMKRKGQFGLPGTLILPFNAPGHTYVIFVERDHAGVFHISLIDDLGATESTNSYSQRDAMGGIEEALRDQFGSINIERHYGPAQNNLLLCGIHAQWNIENAIAYIKRGGRVYNLFQNGQIASVFRARSREELLSYFYGRDQKIAKAFLAQYSSRRTEWEQAPWYEQAPYL